MATTKKAQPQRVTEARAILAELGLPKQQQNKISGLTLLALCRMTLDTQWKQAKRESLTIRKGIMDWAGEILGNPYAENSREQFRRKVIHQFLQAGLAVENPDSPGTDTNSQNYHYAITDEALATVRMFGTEAWEAARDCFLEEKGSLAEKYAGARNIEKVPVKLANGTQLLLSPGAHNQLQASIVEEFGPRFAPGSELLYLGDTKKKNLIYEKAALASLGILLNQHDKMPDVVLYDRKRKWLFLVEAVTSHGPVSPKRIIELEEMLKGCKAGKIYVSAFPNVAKFKKHAADIAWETEVWLADMPDHMMHFNGDRFLGPR